MKISSEENCTLHIYSNYAKANLKSVNSSLKEKKERRIFEGRLRGVDQPLSRVRSRTKVGPVEAKERPNDCVKPEQGQSGIFLNKKVIKKVL